MISDSPIQTEFDAALNMARQSLYRFTALALLDPRAGSWQRLQDDRTRRVAAHAAALVRGEPAAKAQTLARGEYPLERLDPAPVLARLRPSNAEQNEAYERTFGLLVSGSCPPYETEYVNGKFTFQRSQGLSDISGFYSAFGLQPSPEHPERHDHVVLELEFMAFLLGLERQAAHGDLPRRDERVAICRDAQTKFLREHLAWWTPTLARLLSLQDRGGYYEAAGVFLAALVAAERAILGVEVPGEMVGPSKQQRPEECEGCVLAAE